MLRSHVGRRQSKYLCRTDSSKDSKESPTGAGCLAGSCLGDTEPHQGGPDPAMPAVMSSCPHLPRPKGLIEAKLKLERSPEVPSKGRNATPDLISTQKQELKNKNSSSQVLQFLNLIEFGM